MTQFDESDIEEEVGEEQAPPRKERHTWIVAVYLADLGYGGPQEGGWWYDRGQLARIVRTFSSEERAYAYSRRLNHRLRSRKFGPNQGKRDKSSVLSDGFYEAGVHRDHAPHYYPAQKPRYE